MNEAFSSGAEIVRLARMVQSVDVNGATPEEITVFLEDRIQPFFKDYEPSLDQKVLAAMMKIAKERLRSSCRIFIRVLIRSIRGIMRNMRRMYLRRLPYCRTTRSPRC